MVEDVESGCMRLSMIDKQPYLEMLKPFYFILMAESDRSIQGISSNDPLDTIVQLRLQVAHFQGLVAGAILLSLPSHSFRILLHYTRAEDLF